VWLLLLTPAWELADIQGRLRDFWSAYKDRWGAAQYFAWLELTRDGKPHYHMMVVDPPWRSSWLVKPQLEAMWGGFVKLERRPLEWLFTEGGKYATSYAKKLGNKAYQQLYDEVPATVRTFSSSYLLHDPKDLDAHSDRYQWRYVPAQATSKELRPAHLVSDTRCKHHILTEGSMLGASADMQSRSSPARE
jgi:hypothetical protein